MNINDKEFKLIMKVLKTTSVQNLIGAEEWELTEEEEEDLWLIIKKY